MLRLGQERAELRVVADQFGAPTSARALAAATAQVLAQAGGDFVGLLRRRGGTLHACCQGVTHWHEFACEIFRLARQLGAPLAVEKVVPIASGEYPAAAQRPKNSRLDCRRLAERFGVALPDWRTALWDCLVEMPETGRTAATAPGSRGEQLGMVRGEAPN